MKRICTGPDCDCEIVTPWGLRECKLQSDNEELLTPGKLEDAGFETLSVGSYYTSYWQQHKPDRDFVLYWYVADGRIEWEGKILKHMSDLRNLYYDLFKEEL